MTDSRQGGDTIDTVFLVAAILISITDPLQVDRTLVRWMVLNGENYRMEIFLQETSNLLSDRILFLYRGNRVIWSETWGGITSVRKLWWPYSDDAFEIKESSFAGSWDHSAVYRVQGDRVIGPILELPEDTPGGPVYRDLDGDGRAEMIYDNFDHYSDTVEHPMPDEFIVFKINKNLKATRLGNIPNPRHIRLPLWNAHYEENTRQYGEGRYSLNELGLVEYAALWSIHPDLARFRESD